MPETNKCWQPTSKNPQLHKEHFLGFQGSTVICRKFFMVHPNETHRSNLGHLFNPLRRCRNLSSKNTVILQLCFCFGAFFFCHRGNICDICVKHSLEMPVHIQQNSFKLVAMTMRSILVSFGESFRTPQKP